MKFCVISPVFSIAGVPLAQIRLAKALANAGHKVDLIFCRVDSQYEFPNIHNVNVINFNVKKIRWIFLKLCIYLLKNKSLIIFSAEDHLNIMVSICAIFTFSNKSFYKKWILKSLFKLFQWRINVLTCVSKDMIDQYRKVFGVTRHKCVYNIINNKDANILKKEKVSETWIFPKKRSFKLLVAAGTLAPWKGFNYLLKACYLLKIKKFKVKMCFGQTRD